MEELEPIQQWCAYYIWDAQQLVEFLKTQMIAAASLGDHETANRCADKYQEIIFPYLARNKQTYLEASQKILKSLRGVGIKVTQADWKLSDLKGMNRQIFGKKNG